MTEDEEFEDLERRLALGAAYLAGFNASGEGYNAEYPFRDYSTHPVQDAGWCKRRDEYIQEALAEQPAPSSHLTDEQKAANGLAWLARLEAMREEFAGLAEQPAQQQEPVTKRLMDCDHCGGTGVDGDVDDRGMTIDVQCRSCAGSGKSRYFGKCADGKRCLQGCLGTEGCYWEKRAAKEQPAQQQEPVAYWYETPFGWKFCNAKNGRPSARKVLDLYTSPQPSKPWVGLTDDERLEAAEIDGADEWFWKVCKAIEAKLREKNA